MKPITFFERIGQVTAPPLLAADRDKNRTVTLYFLLFLLIGASSILIFITIRQHLQQIMIALLIADGILLGCLFLTTRGNTAIPSYLIPFSMLAINTYIIFEGHGIHDISILGFPMIIAVSGLLIGKRGALLMAALCTLCFSGIVWAELRGMAPNVGELIKYVDIDDIPVLTVLLGITAAVIYFIMNNFSRSLDETLQSESALRKANDELERYAAVLELRTAQLLTGAKVARAASTILEPDELSQRVVSMVCTRFGLYYVSLFLLDATGEWAVLHAGTGKAGKVMLKNNHRLKVGSTSMIGWCIARRKARIALDVGSEAVRFDNPLLPETRSELALPLISRGRVIGALGIQSDKEAAFAGEDILTFQAMADQLANAICNAQLYNQEQNELKERKRVEKQIRQLNTELERRVAKRTHELQTANEHLTSLSHLKDEFLANVSHELRTPLTSIMLYHSLMEKKPQDTPRHISHLKRETDRLTHIIEDLLLLSRLEQGYASFNPVPLDLNRLAQEYVSDRAPLATERQLNLILNIFNQLPHALADEQMTGQVLSVILTNAMNYTPAGGSIAISTQIDESDGRKWTGFSIRDTGPGVTAEDQERLFERFYRGKAGRESHAAGTGLGLAIAREIVHRHNGRIEVQSTGIPGQGTTFFVWLPVANRTDNPHQ